MAENIENNGCSQRDNAEHEGYVKARRSFNLIWKERDSAQPKERLLREFWMQGTCFQIVHLLICIMKF